MKSFAFFNNKGGVGKTTLLCNCAAYLALNLNKKVCVVDADPQCNATQYMISEEKIFKIYGADNSFTIYDIIKPLATGKGYTEEIRTERVADFGLDLMVGDPRLALTEDLLAKDWGDAKAGDVRGIRTNLVFSELSRKLEGYDYVIFDCSPSLGAINRSILLSADAFISPMSIDIFSLKAFENISVWMDRWIRDWNNGINQAGEPDEIPDLPFGYPVFLGYVSQQYFAKKDASGERRAVQAYEKIKETIDKVIKDSLIKEEMAITPFEIGNVPNLFSLIPMSQSVNKPVFELKAKDGVVGAHFAKVKEATIIYGDVAREIDRRMSQ